MLPGDFCLGETLSRLNVWFTSCRWRKWPGFEMESVMFFICPVKGDAHSRGPVFSVFMTKMKSMFGSFTTLADLLFFLYIFIKRVLSSEPTEVVFLKYEIVTCR